MVGLRPLPLLLLPLALLSCQKDNNDQTPLKTDISITIGREQPKFYSIHCPGQGSWPDTRICQRLLSRPDASDILSDITTEDRSMTSITGGEGVRVSGNFNGRKFSLIFLNSGSRKRSQRYRQLRELLGPEAIDWPH